MFFYDEDRLDIRKMADEIKYDIATSRHALEDKIIDLTLSCATLHKHFNLLRNDVLCKITAPKEKPKREKKAKKNA